MRQIKIPKRGGGFRVVYAPGKTMRARLAQVRPWLEAAQSALCLPCVHGFIPGRSPVTAASCHVGYAYTLTVDIQSWYDSCTEAQVAAALMVWQAACAVAGVPPACTGGQLPFDPAKIAHGVCVGGAPRQGLPTSPMAANICGAALDAAVLAELPAGCVYTRYADDLTISGNDKDVLMRLRDEVLPRLVAAHGWALNAKKSRIQCARYGRRVVCGVAVDDHGVWAPRRYRRKLRAQQHRNARSSVSRGMAVWVRFIDRVRLHWGSVLAMRRREAGSKIDGWDWGRWKDEHGRSVGLGPWSTRDPSGLSD